tara:strand:- start:1147 stop:1248 length:102 start_codon:yes stop_codon:yes gene_type:complete
MSDKQKENLEYLLMGIVIGVGLGYMVGMYVVYL